ncbi:hypothetical protein SteCoe_32221 [Stentor coeruleus]|uniref:Uncharacterized protein n=1 Tax=Stentor coeruleus TaxID=5963 RepID=A0A1R2AZI5_9CILI|nr:hypothetical protein SteCoe_32221 [Stentor coeruleus]
MKSDFSSHTSSTANSVYETDSHLGPKTSIIIENILQEKKALEDGLEVNKKITLELAKSIQFFKDLLMRISDEVTDPEILKLAKEEGDDDNPIKNLLELAKKSEPNSPSKCILSYQQEKIWEHVFEKVKILKSKVFHSNKEIVNSFQKCETYKKELNVSNERLRRASVSLEEFQIKMNKIDEDDTKKAEKWKNLYEMSNEKSEKRKEKLDRIKEELEDEKRKYEEGKIRLDQEIEKCEAAERRQKRTQKKLESTLNANDELKNQVEALENKVKEYEEQLELLSATTHAKHKENNEINEELKAKILEITDNYEEEKRKNEEFKAKLEKYSQENNEINEDLKAKIIEITDNYEEEKRKNEEFKVKLENYSEESGEHEKINRLNTENIKLVEELEQIRKENQLLKEKHHRSNSASDSDIDKIVGD